MIAYVDSSVILRVALGEPKRLREWEQLEQGVCSQIARVECLRAIDRLRLRHALCDEEVARRNEAVFSILADLDLVQVTVPVLERAGQPFPTSLGTLDAVHLASALLWQQQEDKPLRFLTHDVELGRAARAMGLGVLG
ncbi:MAG: type II toxin-antitoxin system VapC family toxin [Myxococcaceae bacterium]